MYGQSAAPPKPHVFPGAPANPISAHFQPLAARTLAGRGGRPATVGAPMQAGGIIPAPRQQMTLAPHQRQPAPGMAT